MKRMLLSVCMLCMMLAFLCCSCGWFGPQRYICEVEEVESVQIIRLDQYVEGEYRYEYTVLSEISDYETFVSRLNGLEHSVNWGDPQQLDVGYVVVRIDYRNGDFDLVHPDAQWLNRSGVNHDGYFFFDDEQFNTLISDYTEQIL